MRAAIAWLLGVGSLACAAGCEEAKDSDPRPQEEEGWPRADEPPSWLLAPPRAEGVVRVVDGGQSNRVSLAYRAHEEPVDPTLRRQLLDWLRADLSWRLRPVLGAEADGVAALATDPRLVAKAFHPTPSRPGQEAVLGGSHVTAYVLWELSVAELLDAVPPARRGEARAALEAAEPPGAPPWEVVKAPPEWATKPSVSEGRFAAVVSMTSDRADFAKVDAMVFADSHVAGEAMQRLRPVLDPRVAWAAGRTGATWRTIVRRAVHVEKGGRAVAWTLWEAPPDRFLGAVPERRRAEARAALLGPRPPR